MRNLLFSLVFSMISILSFAQNKNSSIATQIVSQRGEVYISLDIKQIHASKNYLSNLSFDKIDNGRIYFYSNIKGIQALNFNNYKYQVEAIPSMITSVSMSSSVSDFTTNWDVYPTYQQYDSLMHKFAVDYPNLCKFHDLGTLSSGRKILAVQLGDNVYQNENEVKFFYTSTMHGDEVTGYVMMLRMIDYLLTNYNTDAQVQFLMNNVEIWINPLANPDGTYYSGNSTVSGATRYNANSVDINRNFPDPEDGLHPDGNAYQQETQIFMGFADTMYFTMSANLHGGNEVVNYPWDTWSKLHADDAWWIHVSKRFSDSAQYYSPSGYMTYLGGYTNGYQWYSISGGRQDYMNYYQHCRESTMELSNMKTVAENQLPNYWNYLKRSFLYYLQDVTNGFQGQATDSVTHFAVKSKLTILNHDIDSSEVYSNDSGFYYRPIAAGTYDLQFSAPGYYNKTISNISIGQDTAIILNVELVPKPNAIGNSYNEFYVDIFPNPADKIININTEAVIISVSLYSINGAMLVEKENVNSKESKLDVSEFSSGIYFIKVQTNTNIILNKIIID